jgi:hypothetical protein
MDKLFNNFARLALITKDLVNDDIIEDIVKIIKIIKESAYPI